MAGARGARRDLAVMTMIAALLIAQQVAGKATRDALFLASFGPSHLPTAIGVGALLSVGSVIAMGRLLASQGPQRAMAIALVANAALYTLEWLAQRADPRAGAVVLYLHVAAVGAVLVSGLWSVVRERPDPHAAKGMVARVAAGANLGGIMGGIATSAVAHALDARAMLLVLAGANVLTAVLLASLRRPADHSRADVDHAPTSSPATAARTRYVGSIALLGASIALVDTLLGFSLSAAAARELHDAASLAAFFSLFYTGANTLTFGIQTLLGRHILRRLGLGAALASAPGLAALGWLLVVSAPFAAIVALRGGTMALASSIFRSGYEVLFVPLPSSFARATKTHVDVVGARAGDLIAAIAIAAMLAWVPTDSVLPAVLAAAIATAALFLVRRLTRGYVRALETALAAGAVDLGEHASLDATTRRTLEGTGTLDRATVLRAIEERRRRAAESGEDDAPEIATDPASRFHALTQGTLVEARAALRMELEPELVRAAIPALAHPALGADALEALRRVAGSAVGTLADALLDPRLAPDVRARIPRLLVVAGGTRAASALTLGLADESLTIRFHCARALARLQAADRSLAPPRHEVVAACMRELDRHGITWSETARAGPEEPVHDDVTSLDELVRARASRSLELVIVLLSLLVDPEPMRLALAGLASEDPITRATAIELLENIAPSPVREPLVSALVGRPTALAPRTRHEIVEDLLRSQAAHTRGA